MTPLRCALLFGLLTALLAPARAEERPPADFAGLGFLVGRWEGRSEVELAPGAYVPARHRWRFERALSNRDGAFLMGESDLGGKTGISHHEHLIIGYERPGRLMIWRFLEGGVFARAELKRQGEKDEWIALFPPPAGNPGKIHDYRQVIRREGAAAWSLREQTRQTAEGAWHDAFRGRYARVQER